MRRLGERERYGPHRGTLGRAVHYDAHRLLLYGDDTSYPFDGLGSSWLAPLGKGWRSHPSDRLCDEMDRDTDAQAARKRDHLLLEWGLKQLRVYDPHLYAVTRRVCGEGGATMALGRNLRHSGPVWDGVVDGLYDGDDGKLWRHLQAAWGVVAVLVVDADVLRAAQEAGAVDPKALAWRTERGLV